MMWLAACGRATVPMRSRLRDYASTITDFGDHD
jgi:hypothetical protein